MNYTYHITKGATPTSYGFNFVEDGINFIKIETISDNGQIIDKKLQHIDEETHNFMKRSSLRENDILFSIAGALGRVAIINKVYLPANINQAMAIIRLNSNNINLKYLFYFLQSVHIKKYIYQINVQAAQANLSLDDIRNISVIVPTSPEQKKIAEILSTWDHAIERTEKLIEEKEKLKKGLMQQLLTGKVRFKEFVKNEGFKETKIGMIPEDWDIKKLKYLCNKFLNGGTPSTKIEKYWVGEIPWISGADIVNQEIHTIRRKITREAVANSSTNIIEKGNLIMVTRTGVGKLTIAPFDLAISQDITGLYIRKILMDVGYLFYYFDIKSTYLSNLNQGTSINGITREVLENQCIPVPSIGEQRKIVTVLHELDDEVSALRRNYLESKIVKQGLMQQLLTGKIRVKIEET